MKQTIQRALMNTRDSFEAMLSRLHHDKFDISRISLLQKKDAYEVNNNKESTRTIGLCILIFKRNTIKAQYHSVSTFF